MLLKLLYLILLFSLISLSPVSLAESALTHHPSRYIQMHAADAVKWRILDQSVLEQAKKENKLIFVSIGFYACHWCHVMRKESFADKEIGDFMNAHFVAVKVDRELNPVLDDYLLNFLKKVNGYGGWPLNVFLTPQGYPLAGMVYKPAKEFKAYLENIQNKWMANDKELSALAKSSFDYFSQDGLQGIESDEVINLSALFMESLHEQADELMGGLGAQTKFPREPLMLMLLDLYKHNSDQWLKEYIVLTLDKIMTRGLHDVVNGGFFRYTVDADWSTPHFEKMLYTNAGLIQVYLKAYQIFKSKKYLEVAVETMEFMLREMKTAAGGFVSSINSQDVHGAEGGGYLWNINELENLLDIEQVSKVKKHWNYVRRENSTEVLPVGLALENEWLGIKQKLQSKIKQVPHALDDKFLPGWNGYALTSLAKIYAITERDDFRLAGQNLYQLLYVRAKTGLQRDGAQQPIYLEDYAFVAQGLNDWQQSILNSQANAVTVALISDAVRLFKQPAGWRLSSEQLLPMPSIQINLADSQLPAADVVMLNLLKRNKGDAMLAKISTNSGSGWLDARLMKDPVGFASRVQYELISGDKNKPKQQNKLLQ